MVLAKGLNQFVQFLGEVEEDNRMSLRELQVQHMLIPSLVRTVNLKRKPNLFLGELLLLVLLCFVDHGVAFGLAACSSCHVYALYTVLLI